MSKATNTVEVMKLLSLSDFKRAYLESSIQYNVLPEKELIRQIRDAEDSNDEFRAILLPNKKFSDQNVGPLLFALKKDINIIKLDLSNNQLTTLKPFYELFKSNNTLQYLDLSNNPIELSEIPGFVSFMKNSSLKALNLSHSSPSFTDASRKLYQFANYNDSPEEPSFSANHKAFQSDTSSKSSIVSTDNTVKTAETPENDSPGENPKLKNFDIKMKMSRIDWIMSLKKIFDEVSQNQPNTKISSKKLIDTLYNNRIDLPLSDPKSFKPGTDAGYSFQEVILALKSRLGVSATYDDVLDIVTSINKPKEVQPIKARISSGKTPTPAAKQAAKVMTSPQSTLRGSQKLKENFTINLTQQKISGPTLSREKSSNSSNHNSNINSINTSSISGLTSEQKRVQKQMDLRRGTRDSDESTLKAVLENSRRQTKQKVPMINMGRLNTTTEDHRDSFTAQVLNRSQMTVAPIKLEGQKGAQTLRNNISPEKKSISHKANTSRVRTSMQQEDKTPEPFTSPVKELPPQRVQPRGISSQPKVRTPQASEKTQRTQDDIFLKGSFAGDFLAPEAIQEPEAKTSRSGTSTATFKSDKGSHSRSSSPIMSRGSVGPNAFNLNVTAPVNTSEKKKNYQSTPESNKSPSRLMTHLQNKIKEASGGTPLSKGQHFIDSGYKTATNRRQMDSNSTLEISSPSVQKQIDFMQYPESRKESKASFKPLVNASQDQSISKVNKGSTGSPSKDVKLAEKFIEFITNINTFCNENSHILKQHDLDIITQINSYQQLPSDEGVKIALTFENLGNIVIKDLTIHPLIKSMLQYIEVLQIKRCLFEQDSFAELIGENVRVLNLSGNNITELKCLRACRSLEFINLSNNQITEIKGFIMCPRIKEIILKNNRITAIKNLAKCTDLRLLDLSQNKISSFEGLESIKSNNRLEVLSLRGNLITQSEEYEDFIGTMVPSLQVLDPSHAMDHSEYKEFEVYAFGRKINERDMSPIASARNTIVGGPIRGIIRSGTIGNRSVTPRSKKALKTSFADDTQEYVNLSNNRSRMDASFNSNQEPLRIDINLNILDDAGLDEEGNE